MLSLRTTRLSSALHRLRVRPGARRFSSLRHGGPRGHTAVPRVVCIASSNGNGDEDGPGSARVLEGLRRELKVAGVDAILIPTEDPHSSEYPALYYARREFVSGFTGSYGQAAVSSEPPAAALTTDGRYFLQAEMQLSKEFELLKAGLPDVPTINEWLVQTLSRGGKGRKVGIDPLVHSIDSAHQLAADLEREGHSLVFLKSNPLDVVWGDDRPPMPEDQVRVHDIKYAGRTVEDKLKEMRFHMKENDVQALLVTTLDEIAWLYNIRGSDVPHCPVALSYALVELASATLFTNPDKVNAECRAHLDECEVKVQPYEDIAHAVQQVTAEGSRIWIDPATCNIGLLTAAETGEGMFSGPSHEAGAILQMSSPVSIAKAQKNLSELTGMKNAHIRDGVALATFFHWLEHTIGSGGTPTEVEAAEVLRGMRAAQEGYLTTSFDTIAGSGANGAIIHYRAEEETCARLDPHKLFLLDSGGQYIDGTTDVTRTMHFGTPSQRQRECFTYVLKGNIALDQCVFPEGTPGHTLDVVARGALWKAGLDYRHGTGHGVGAALNVHEGPCGISPRINNTPLEPGMILSNEPGYYEDGAFGIRIENLLIVRKVDTPNRFGDKAYYGFERLTKVPIQKKLIDTSMLNEDEIAWVDSYHREVWDCVSPLVEDASVREWLKDATSPLEVLTPLAA